MKVSTRVRYALRALVELAASYGEGPVFVGDIARRQNISRKYLENLLVELKSAGIVKSIRGSRGGYELTRPPEKITVEEVAEAIEGSIALTACVEDPNSCERTNTCPTRELWIEMTERLRELMRATSVRDLYERSVELAEREALMYYI